MAKTRRKNPLEKEEDFYYKKIKEVRDLLYCLVHSYISVLRWCVLHCHTEISLLGC